jgi:hypothetical protein
MAGFTDSVTILNNFFTDKLHFEVIEQILETGRYYTVKITASETQVIKNYYLFSQYLQQLLRDLLYYNDISIKYLSVVFDFDITLEYQTTITQEILNHKYMNFSAGNLFEAYISNE